MQLRQTILEACLSDFLRWIAAEEGKVELIEVEVNLGDFGNLGGNGEREKKGRTRDGEIS